MRAIAGMARSYNSACADRHGVRPSRPSNPPRLTLSRALTRVRALVSACCTRTMTPLQRFADPSLALLREPPRVRKIDTVLRRRRSVLFAYTFSPPAGF